MPTTKKTGLSEKAIEQKYVKWVRSEIGGRAFKFAANHQVGIPDRLVVLPGGHIFFVEFKAPGGKLTKIQKKMHDDLLFLSAAVFVFDDLEQAQETTREIYWG